MPRNSAMAENFSGPGSTALDTHLETVFEGCPIASDISSYVMG